MELVSPSSGTLPRSWATAKIRILNSTDSAACDPTNSSTATNLGFGGRSGSLYLICSLKQLNRVRNNLALNYRVVTDLDLDPSLDSDADVVGDQAFVPITGNFTGTFDGNERILKNFRFTQAVTSTTPTALFSSIGGSSSIFVSGINLIDARLKSTFSGGEMSGIVGTISNVISTLEDNHFAGLIQSTGSGSSSGGIFNKSVSVPATTLNRNFSTGQIVSDGGAGGIFVGLATDGSAANLSYAYSTVNVTSGGGSIGGLVGQTGAGVTCRNCSQRIRNSHSSGLIYMAGGEVAGGLVGTADAYDGVDFSIEDSYSSADVYNGHATGGLIGLLYCDTPGTVDCGLTRVHSSGFVHSNTSGGFVGGLVGYLGFPAAITVSDSYSSSVVTGSGSVNSLAGFIGKTENQAHGATPHLVIDHCYATGNVSADSGANIPTGSFINDLRAQGAGASVIIRDSYATGNANSGSGSSSSAFIGSLSTNGGSTAQILRVHSTGSASAGYVTGGIIGYLAPSNDSTIELKDSYSTSAITVVHENGGGLVGYLELSQNNTSVTMSNNYHSTGLIRSTTSNSVGGLFGAIRIRNASNLALDISNSFATGNITTATGGAGGISSGIECTGTGTAKTAHFSKLYYSGTITSNNTGGFSNFTVAQAGCNIQIDNSYSTGTVDGSNTGGFVSYAEATGGGIYGINKVYSTVHLIGPSATGLGFFSGVTPVDSYWLKDTGINSGSTDDGNQHDAVWMQNSANYSGWVFSPVMGAPWIIAPGAFPTLQ
ncbi:MAG: hypothetical protein EOP09_04850 [Proteobacteria bacterium]|nr:MAG: hypothetical protein EOP09_04850 [Pseudomonadota bacterium]